MSPANLAMQGGATFPFLPPAFIWLLSEAPTAWDLAVLRMPSGQAELVVAGALITCEKIEHALSCPLIDGHGVRDYVERFFVGYHTVGSLLSATALDHGRASARVDFAGDFGHEIGRLDLAVDDDGLITRIDADL